MVCGLPRSRTAWFSVVTSTARSLCYHEPVARTASFEELASIWKPVAGIGVGVSDSALSLHLGRILRELEPRTLIVERPISDVVASMDNYMAGLPNNGFDGHAYLMALCREIEAHRSHPLVKMVAFDDLDDYGTVSDCLKWLLPDVDFPDLKFLMTMKIEVRRDYVLGLVARGHNLWHMETSP